MMKLNLLAVIAVAGLLATVTSFAQNSPDNGPRGQGQGYGRPPASQEERAARQAACLERNGGVCPQGGVCAPGQGRGPSMGRGQGRGLCDGTGARRGNGTCPQGNLPQQPRQR